MNAVQTFLISSFNSGVSSSFLLFASVVVFGDPFVVVSYDSVLLSVLVSEVVESVEFSVVTEIVSLSFSLLVDSS